MGRQTPDPDGNGRGERALGTDLGLLALTVIWGVNFPVVKAALEELHPLAFNALRFPLAAATLWLILRLRNAADAGDRTEAEVGSRASAGAASGSGGPDEAGAYGGGRPGSAPSASPAGSALWSGGPLRADLVRIVALAALGHIVYQLLFIYGLDATLAGNAAILLATTPVWVTLLSTLRGHERPGVAVWVGVAATVAGMVAVVAGGAARVELGQETLRGDLLSIAAAVVWAFYTVEGRDVVHRYGALRVTAWTLWLGTAALVLLGIPALMATDFGAVSPVAWSGVAYAGVLAIGVAYLIWYWAVRRIGSSRTAVYSNLVPVVALVTAWIWLGETPTGLQLAGAAVVIGGLSLTRLPAGVWTRPWTRT